MLYSMVAVRQETDRRGKAKRGEEGDLREGKGHQSTTNHYKVKDVPQVPEIRTLV